LFYSFFLFILAFLNIINKQTNKQIMKKEMNPEVKEIELSKEEREVLEQRREVSKRQSECSEKINEVLQEFGMDLVVNPNSPLNNLQLTLVPKQG
jgi:CRISPR/Cas system Type II protein with McrA/HNH and RuvC-like nuclease domain